jgi:hypothetical protein
MLVATFIRDRLVRSKEGLPLGRVVLVDDNSYEKGVATLYVALLECPTERVKNLFQTDFYIDGILYRVQDKVNMLRISKLKNKTCVNHVYLERVV